MSEQQAQANEGQQRAAEVFHSTADTWALRCWNDWALRYWNEINECLDVEAALGAVAASPDEDREAAIERGAKAGQALAVHWGHQPWSDSWARLVAVTILAGEATPSSSKSVQPFGAGPADEGLRAADREWKAEDAEPIARAFHDAYERLAPTFGYKTREASAVPWEDVPPENKALMRATIASLLCDGVIVPAADAAAGCLPEDEKRNDG